MVVRQKPACALLSLGVKQRVKALARERAEFSAEGSTLLLIKARRSQERQYPITGWAVPVMLDAVSAINYRRQISL